MILLISNFYNHRRCCNYRHPSHNHNSTFVPLGNLLEILLMEWNAIILLKYIVLYETVANVRTLICWKNILQCVKWF